MSALMTAKDAREEILLILPIIERYQRDRNAWVAEWKRLCAEAKDPGLEKPEELKKLGRLLFEQYTRKDYLLRGFPILQDEFGPPFQKKKVKDAMSKPGNRARKKANHEANLARRKVEDRARGARNKGGSRK